MRISGVYKAIESYAPQMTIKSKKCPEGRVEHGFVFPVDFSSEDLVSLGEAGLGDGKYLLIASLNAIEKDEEDAQILWCGRIFKIIRREEYGVDGGSHIECLLRCMGGD